jgi:hypothetical protein
MTSAWNRLVGKKTRKLPQRLFWGSPELLEERCQPSTTGITGFRTIDEVGNNVANPDWGAAPADQPGGAAIQLLRFSPVAYANGFSTPSLPGGGNANTPPEPSPRTVSNDVFNQSPTLFGSPSTDINTADGNGLSDFGYSFGQFMDHDMDLTLDQGGFPVPNPNTNKDGNDGFPIPVDKTNPGDPIGSLAFSRSQFDPTTGTDASNPRQQTTVITAYLDLSQVYGSSQVVADALRTFSGGLLKTSPGNMLPFNSLDYFTQDQLDALAMQNNGPLTSDQLFAAGDARANENTELTSLTTLFVRNHNNIAAELAQQDPTQFGFTSWTDENLYQEARKINIAEYQNIIYTQYLPDLLGPTAMPAYTGYDPTVNATIDTEFSTVAFRFGHSMLNNIVARDANDGTSLGALSLEFDFFDPNLVNASGAIDPFTGMAGTDIGAYLKGDADNTAQAVDTMATSNIRDLLFGNGVPGGEDLISRDIWRARDNGIGTYNQVRVAFGLAPITNDATGGFDQITSNVTVQQELEKAYATTLAGGGFAGDIDPFVGGLAEDHVPGSDMGPLFTKILADQFGRLETGDQFFYLNESFTTAELSILQQGTALGQIITTNTGVTNLQSDVFLNPVISQQNAASKSFFLSPAGEQALTGSTTGTTLSTGLYNSLVSALANPNKPGYTVLVDTFGNYEPASFLQSYNNVKFYLLFSNPINMGYSLSAQLLTTEFNVLLGNVTASSSIYLPAVTFAGQPLSSTLQSSLVTNNVSTASGVANIQTLLTAAVTELSNAPLTFIFLPSNDLTFESALVVTFYAINSNENIFIG